MSMKREGGEKELGDASFSPSNEKRPKCNEPHSNEIVEIPDKMQQSKFKLDIHLDLQNWILRYMNHEEELFEWLAESNEWKERMLKLQQSHLSSFTPDLLTFVLSFTTIGDTKNVIMVCKKWLKCLRNKMFWTSRIIEAIMKRANDDITDEANKLQHLSAVRVQATRFTNFITKESLEEQVKWVFGKEDCKVNVTSKLLSYIRRKSYSAKYKNHYLIFWFKQNETKFYDVDLSELDGNIRFGVVRNWTINRRTRYVKYHLAKKKEFIDLSKPVKVKPT